MMRHMAYVISVKDHELQYGGWMSMIFDAFGVPLVDKKGEESKRASDRNSSCSRSSSSGCSRFGSVEGNDTIGVDPSGPFGFLRKAVMNKLQGEFERASANRFQVTWRRLESRMRDS
ncbi:hypothetical protein Dimus_035816 [Dionaea muscipula]